MARLPRMSRARKCDQQDTFRHFNDPRVQL